MFANLFIKSTAMDEKKSRKSSKAHQQVQTAVELTPVQEPAHEKFNLSETFAKLKKRPKCCAKCSKILYLILAFVAIIKAVGVIVTSIITAIATKVYDQDQSGRLVAQILVAVTAAVTVAICVYAIVAVFTKKNRPIHAASIVLLVLALIQAIIVGSTLRITDEDKNHLARSLAESFRLAKEHNPRNVKTWAATQQNLNCCGLYGSEDYRQSNVPTYFAPDVPISCCPAYDPSRSDLVQEREREQCKAKKAYYDVGCKYPVMDMYVDSTTVSVSILAGLIAMEILLCITGAILSKKQIDASRRRASDNEHQAANGK